MTPVFIGLDLSLSSTGLAVQYKTRGVTTARTESLAPPAGVMGAARLHWLHDALESTLSKWKVEAALAIHARDGGGCNFFAAIEGYAMAGSGRVTGLAEWGGVARLVLQRLQIPVLCIAPSSLKLWMAGHGFADKAMMRRAVLREGVRLKWMMPRQPENDDEIDALALSEAVRYRAAVEHLQPPPWLDAKRRAALLKAQWETSAGRKQELPLPARSRK